tara:strand:+ start:2389 stop:4476 length:2088 start_codon:yes stop_codon:yes gene_type:complete
MGKTRVRVVREKSTGKLIRKTYYKPSGEVQQVSYKKSGGTRAVTYKKGKATRYVETGSKPLTGKALQDAIKAGEEYEKTGMVTKTASAGLNTMTSAQTAGPTLTSTKTPVSPAKANLQKAKEYAQVKRYQETQLREKEGVRITSRVYQPKSNVVGSGLTTYTAEAGFSRKGRQLASLKPEYINIEETPQSLQPTKTPLSTAKSRVAGSVPPIDWEGKFGDKLQDDSRPLSFGTQLGRGIKAPAELGGLIVKGSRKASEFVKLEPAGKTGVPLFPLPGSPVLTTVSQAERGLKQSSAVQQAGIETEQEMFQERSGVGKFAAAYFPGFSAYKSPEYKDRVTTKLIEKGYSTKQAEMGAAALSRERQAGAGGAVGAAVTAELAGELTGQGLVTRALRKTKLIKGSQTAFGIKQLGPSFFVAGAAEGAVQYGAQKATQREKVTISGTLGSAALGGAIAAPLGAKIATLPATKAKWAMRGVYAVEPLEYAGDVLGAGILKQAGARTPVTVIVPPTLGGGTIYGTTSPTTASARGRRTTTPSAVVDVTRAPVAAPTTTLTASRTAITPSFTPTSVTTPSIIPSPFLMPSFTPTPSVSPSTSFTPSTTLLPSVSSTVSATPSTTITPSPVLTVVEDIPFIDFPGGGGYRRRKRGRRRIPTPRARYKPSLAGLFDPKTIAKAPTFVTGIGIRRRVKKKKRGKK